MATASIDRASTNDRLRLFALAGASFATGTEAYVYVGHLGALSRDLCQCAEYREQPFTLRRCCVCPLGQLPALYRPALQISACRKQVAQ